MREVEGEVQSSEKDWHSISISLKYNERTGARGNGSPVCSGELNLVKEEKQLILKKVKVRLHLNERH